MKPRTVNRIVVIVCVVLLLVLAALFARDAVLTNRIAARLAAFEPGTPFTKVVAANGEPDRIDEVQGAWKWGRRMRPLPANVKRVAIYTRQIKPLVCAFLLDENDVVVEVIQFAGY
jgi:Flp pilus assembly protein CpaB